ncbi:MAG TPA: hypothetical protein PLH94_15265, partial [Fimbriimonadaceae bacterium]|nr:hypothetical protein [Fimbriimonadaceae bacterium]
MRKKKPPFLALTVLVVLLGIVGFANYTWTAKPSADAHDHGSLDNPVPKEDTKGDEKSTKEQMKGQIRDMVGMSRPGTNDSKQASNDKPTVVKEKPAKYKPVPSDSTVSGMWYTDES